MSIFPLRNRWGILATLFLSRMTMAFQFQSVAALANPYMDYLAINLSEIGFLIGLYFIPGLFIALPGGAIGKFFGDNRTIIFGLVLMVAGAAFFTSCRKKCAAGIFFYICSPSKNLS